MSAENCTPLSPKFYGPNVVSIKGVTRQILIPVSRFGFHVLSTGPLLINSNGSLITECRVIAFSWAAYPDPQFHSCN